MTIQPSSRRIMSGPILNRSKAMITKAQFDELVIDVLASMNDHVDDENNDRDMNDLKPHYTMSEVKLGDIREYLEMNE